MQEVKILRLSTGEDVIAKVYDAKDSSANTYELNLGPNTTGHSFNFV